MMLLYIGYTSWVFKGCKDEIAFPKALWFSSNIPILISFLGRKKANAALMERKLHSPFRMGCGLLSHGGMRK